MYSVLIISRLSTLRYPKSSGSAYAKTTHDMANTAAAAISEHKYFFMKLPPEWIKIEVTKTDITFCSEPAKAIKIKAKYDVKAADGSENTEEKEIYETMVYVFRGSYSGCVTASSFDEDKTGEVLDMFSKLQ